MNYLDGGSYNVKLTVINDKGIKNSSVVNIVVESMGIKVSKELTTEISLLITGAPTLDAASWLDKGNNALKNLIRPDEALQAFDKAIQLDPNNAEAWSAKGAALVQLGRPDEALQALDKAMLLNPYLADPWSIKGGTLYRLGRPNEALQASYKATKA